MKQRKQRSPKSVASRKRTKPVSEFSEDRQLEIRGGKIYLHGRLAEEMADRARILGVSIQEVFNEGLRIGLPMLLAGFRAHTKKNPRKVPVATPKKP